MQHCVVCQLLFLVRAPAIVWQKCQSLFHCYISSKLTYNEKSHYTTTVEAVLGQTTTGGGAEHLEEQLASVQIPAMTKVGFIELE